MAKNDWIVAGLNNPDFTPRDFNIIADMSLDNTQMLSKDEYLKSDFIKNHELFKDDTGNFSQARFEKYHQKRLQEFLEFLELEFPKGPQLDMFDTDRTSQSRVKNIKFDLGRHVNPDRQAVGIEGVRVWSDPTQTKSEIALSQKIWDTAKKEFKDFSSNDKALSNGLFDWLGQIFSDPLVMAQWEKNGEHTDPITGLTKTHKKGDYKLNDKGTYYYETLNNRNPIGKEVLSVFDTLTVDGEGINKYDFFDSDDVEKSISGVIAKNVVSLLPLFTPVGAYYSAILVAKEFSKAMPMLYGIATSLSDLQESPKWVNNVAAWGTKFSGSTSQYAKENTFSFENFGNLIADVALQWGQQKAIATGINKLRSSKTYLDDAIKDALNLYKIKAKELGDSEELWEICQNKFVPKAQKLFLQSSQLGRDASLAYMAIVSNSDLYNEMRNMGLTNFEASAVALGSTLGMFGLNKYTGLGEIFFDDATDDAVKLARQAVKAEIKSAKSMFDKIKNSNLPEPNKYLKYIKTASDKVKDVFSTFLDDLKYHTLNFAGKAAGEGLEEVSEELISDVAKEIYQLAGYFGADTTLKDVGAWDNALERYTMSFLGGAIGGGIFYGKEALIDGKSYKKDLKNQEIATLIRNGHANELRAEIEKLKKDGKIANTKLSASKYSENDKGEKVWLTTDNKGESQNDAIANAMLDKIDSLEAVINNNRVGLSDDELFDNMVLSEKRYRRYEKIAGLTNYYQDFADIVDNLIEAELNYRKASTTIDGTVDGAPRTDAKLTPEQESLRQANLTKLSEEIEKYQLQKEEFLSGETSLEYTRKLNFILDPMLHSQYLSIDRNLFFKEQYGGRNYGDLNPEEIIKFELDWLKKVEDFLKTKNDINQSWNRYKEIEALMLPELQALEENTPEYKKFIEQTLELVSLNFNIDELKKSFITGESKLEDETDEEFEFRDTKLTIDGEKESDIEFNFRRSLRAKKINDYNIQKAQEWVDKINAHLAKVDYNLDPFTYRELKRSLPFRLLDIVSYALDSAGLTSLTKLIFKNLKPDLSNIKEIEDVILKVSVLLVKTKVSNILNKLKNLNLVDLEGDPVDIYEYISNSEDAGLTLSKIVGEITESGEYTGIKLDVTGEDSNGVSFVEYLASLIPYIGGDITLGELIETSNDFITSQPQIEEYAENLSTAQKNELHSIISNINSNPIYKFANTIKLQVKNPIGLLIKTLSEKNGDSIQDIDALLDIILDDYENIEDVNLLLLNDSQIENLKKIKDYLNLINGFMYAASSNPNKYSPIGHNQVINSFAKAHSDRLRKEWEPLPEIDSDYFVLYDGAIAKYSSEIDYWIDFSNDNNVNKIRKFVATDAAFNKALFESIKSKTLKFKINEEEFDLLEGLVETDEGPETNLFNAEKLLYKNFQKAFKKSGLTIEEFLLQSKLLELLIPSLTNIAKQNVANLTDTLKSTDLTDFDLIQYFAQVFTLNPSKFYSELKSKVKLNKKVAPITALEYSTKLAKAITNQLYRDIMKVAYKRSNSKLPYLSNSLVIPGVAGAGKTSVVLSSVNDPNEEIIVAGPTKKQAELLLESLNRSNSYTFRQLLETILGTKQLADIETEFDKVKNGNTIKTYDCNYFTVENINGVAVVKLKRDSIKFNKLQTDPKKIFLDEATHLGSLQILILDAFAESVGAVNYLAGDPNQRGAFNKKAKTENLQEDLIFCSRAPKLSISLRDNNLQKYINLENVRSLLDLVNDHILNDTIDELEQFWPKALNTLHKFNFRVYNHDVLNGDLITKDLSNDLINKIKSGAEIGFIGDKNSPYLQKLKNAGINPTVLSMDEMQGSEFDYVIIDQQWSEPPVGFNIKMFLTDLYTAMTRARTASIFIDNGLSDVIGKNILSTDKSQAPSILEGVTELREKKLNILDKFELDLSEDAEEKPSKKVIKNELEDLIDPDSKNLNAEIKEKIVLSVAKDEDKVKEVMSEDFAADGELILETFTDITILGAETGKTKEVTIQRNGKDEVKVLPVWEIKHPSSPEEPLRNLQAFYENGKELVRYTDKEEALQMLFDIKSAIIFKHSFDDLPNSLRNGFFRREDWDKGVLELEIREPSNSDTTHLNAHYDEPGILYNGKRYIVNVVFKVKLRNDKIAKFDISGLPELNLYNEHLSTIKDNLKARIAKAKDSEKESLLKRLNGVNATFNNYKQLLERWISEYNSNTFKPIELSENSLNYNLTTWFLKLKTSEREAGLLLGGYYDPITGVSRFDPKLNASVTKPDRSRDSLKKRHPELVFSPIYTFAADKDTFEELDPSIKGSAVVLVSSDTLLDPKDLLDIWQEQKFNPNSNKARVRMLILDNYGMTFSLFIDPQFIKAFQRGDEERKPYRLNFTGIRMFTALWNWRASLKQFNTALKTWQTDNNYTEEQVDILAEASQLVYDKLDPSSLLSKFDLKLEDLENLNKFNLEICKNIPIFRLGHSKKGNGFYVRQEDVKSSIAYNKDTVNLLAITRQKAELFEALIGRIMSAIEYSDKYGQETLGVRLLKSDGSSWDEEELIDINDNPEHKRTLSGLLFTQHDKLLIQADGKNIAYTQGTLWSMIPALVSSIVRTITYFLHHPSEINSNTVQYATVTIKENDERVLLKTQVDDIFSDGTLQFGNDFSLFDMLNLAFHGTTDDIHKKLPKGLQLMQLEDAYFKRGFFISPDVTRVWDKNGQDYKLISIDDADGNAIFYQIDTSEEFFTVDTDVRTAGIGLRINTLYNQIEEQKKESEVKKAYNEKTPELVFKEEHPILSNYIELANLLGEDIEYTLEGALEAAAWFNSMCKTAIKSLFNKKDKETLLEASVLAKWSNNTIILSTMSDYISETIGTNTFDVDFGEKEIIIKTTEKSYTLDIESLTITEDVIVKPIEKKLEKPIEEPTEKPTKESIEGINNKWETELNNNKTAGLVLISLLNDENIIERMKTDELTPVDEEEIGLLLEYLENIFKDGSDDEIDSKINELPENILNAYTVLLSCIEDSLDNPLLKALNKIINGC